MIKTFEQQLFDMLESDDTYQVKPVVDVVNNKLYYQTSPYVRDGKVVIKRIAEYDILIEKAYNVVEEYTLTTSYEDKNEST